MASPIPARARWRFQAKIAAALALAALADILFFDIRPGSVLGLFALAWGAVTVATQPALRRDKVAWAMMGAATAMAFALVLDPGSLAWALFWSSLSAAVLAPRYAVIGDAWQWFRRLMLHGVTGLFAPLTDWVRVQRLNGRAGRIELLKYGAALVLPVVGGSLFLLLFAEANPLINDALPQLSLPSLDGRTVLRILFWIVIVVTVWASLRPRRLRFRPQPLQQGDYRAIPGIGLVSVLLSLILFNLMFALQNGLDLAVMFAGVALPDGTTYAQYAHRGAYPLIATALLAGGFVLLTTEPGSPMAQNKWVRGLVVAWVAQNLMLVAFSIIRTLNYVSAYLLTEMRIAALLWMVLVAVGLILITVRLLTGKTSAWLVNGNAIAATLVLAGCSFVDLGEVSAGYNTRHARETGGHGVELDLCYLNQLGGSALVPLAGLQMRPDLQPGFRVRVDNVRQQILLNLDEEQRDWRSWEARNAMRLARIPQALRQTMIKDPRSFGCDGSAILPAEEAPAAIPIDAE